MTPRLRLRAVGSALALVVAVTGVAIVAPAPDVNAETTYTRLVLDGEAMQAAVPGHLEITDLVRGQKNQLEYFAFRGSGYQVWFLAPTGQSLAVGVYEGVTEPEGPTSAGMHFDTPFGTPGCSGLSGRFVIEELGVGDDGEVDQLSARFEIECGPVNGTVFGAIAFNATEPPLSHRVAPRSVDFGTLEQHSVAPVKKVALRNSSPVPMPVGTLTTSAPFSIVDDGCSLATLAPAELCYVDVTVSTTPLGTRTRVLKIPDGFTTWDGSGAFDVVLTVSVVEDPMRFTEEALRIPGRLVPLVGDWDGDEDAHDILFYAPGIATDAYWFANGDRTWTKRYLSVKGHYIPIVGYFDADSVTDVLWYAPGSDTDWLWLGKPGGGVKSSRALRIDGWFFPVTGDFDGNGLDDILWYGAGSAPDSLWMARGGGRFDWRPTAVHGVYDWVFTWDHDGNGRTDLLWWRIDRERHPGWTAAPGGAFGSGTFRGGEVRGLAGAYPIPGNFNADARTDLFWYGPAEVGDTLVLTGFGQVGYSVSGDYAPISANFSGDSARLDELLWWNVRSSNDHYWTSDSGKLRAKTYSNTHLSWNPTWPAIGYFDSVSANDAVDILWYGEGAAPDRMFWGKDVDGPPGPAGTLASGAAPDRVGREELRRMLWGPAAR